ncbi:hypothetical protein [Mycoplasma putrefaciens]|uniref:Uncharacterized protein n=1 Tax=Mycoplasma putrefaciens (strain ATCC 15718 / NCTC 10155 / C30 KS-1 / KS-1) TaxID=743965 RepID=A0A7U3ZSL2_MYCPK|nr:hypothetical protein [Mycoplasma putrefaciens]AEM68766.1 uncharacterized protein MPUT_0391 [Mycoplasma putrefaciens KS1]
MTVKDLNLINLKLKQLIQASKQKDISNQQLVDIANYATNVVDNFLIQNQEIAYYLNNELQLQKNKLDLEINQQIQLLEKKLVDQFLHLLKTLIAILLARKTFCNLEIFEIIKANLIFYVRQSLEDSLYDSTETFFNIWDQEFHLQQAIFNYLYDNFNKMTYHMLNLDLKYNLKPLTKFENNYVFKKDFVNLAFVFYKTRGTMNRSDEFFKQLNKSLIFNLIEKLKYYLDHFYLNKENNLNISNTTKSLFIIICRIILQIEFDFKSNQEITKLIDLNSNN